MNMKIPEVSVIVPGHNASGTLRSSLHALRSQDWPREFLEIVYVDDASTDNSIEVASGLADRIVQLTGLRRGPAAARNAGAREAGGEILVFIDADVLAPPETIRAFAELLSEDEALDAAFGSYDSEPLDRTLVSQYRNLLHHFVHQTSRRNASTFWAGCGAVRKGSFERAGGFDAERYRNAMIEDIELGHRMRALGMRIRLQPSIQVKHLKRWTLFQVVRSDIFYRGIPWMRLLFQDSQSSGELGDLNLKIPGVLSAALAWTGVLLASILFWNPKLFYLMGAIFALGVLVNWRTVRFFWRVRGPWFAVKIMPLHILYDLYNGASFIAGLVCHFSVDRFQNKSHRLRRFH
jgi:glycosyltransferase involved in cell wall biosynthesis